MNVTHKFTPTGYHYVRALDYHHLYAQWPVGTRLGRGDISHGLGYISEETIEKFAAEAQRAADQTTTVHSTTGD